MAKASLQFLAVRSIPLAIGPAVIETWQQGEPDSRLLQTQRPAIAAFRVSASLTNERIRHVNRIKGLLFRQGVSDYEPLRRDRRKRLEECKTDDGRPLLFVGSGCIRPDRGTGTRGTDSQAGKRDLTIGNVMVDLSGVQT
ncbi:hypothetical protein ACVIRO_006062 [Rhizobium ruizarguesonis]